MLSIEAEVTKLYDDAPEERPLTNRQEFEDIIRSEYRQLGCFQEADGLCIRNDARTIRLTFLNGSIMEITNSEWGSILLGNC